VYSQVKVKLALACHGGIWGGVVVGPLKIYRTIVLHVVLYGCETWSLALREERRLRVFENRVPKV
jgi:hypothetical protein